MHKQAYWMGQSKRRKPDAGMVIRHRCCISTRCARQRKMRLSIPGVMNVREYFLYIWWYFLTFSHILWHSSTFDHIISKLRSHLITLFWPTFVNILNNIFQHSTTFVEIFSTFNNIFDNILVQHFNSTFYNIC
jgi:hypothetical protein